MIWGMNKPHRLFKAFADETRLRILNLLAQRPYCVCEFQSVLRVPQPKISRHLAYLRRNDLATEKRRGKWIIYSLAAPRDRVHAALLHCVKGCFQEIDFFKRDLQRARKTKPICCA